VSDPDSRDSGSNPTILGQIRRFWGGSQKWSFGGVRIARFGRNSRGPQMAGPRGVPGGSDLVWETSPMYTYISTRAPGTPALPCYECGFSGSLATQLARVSGGVDLPGGPRIWVETTSFRVDPGGVQTDDSGGSKTRQIGVQMIVLGGGALESLISGHFNTDLLISGYSRVFQRVFRNTFCVTSISLRSSFPPRR